MKLKDTLRQRLLKSIAKLYQNRAESLFNFMKDKVRIGAKGEIYREDGEPTEGSKRDDLIQHAVRDRRRKMNPYGWKEIA